MVFLPQRIKKVVEAAATKDGRRVHPTPVCFGVSSAEGKQGGGGGDEGLYPCQASVWRQVKPNPVLIVLPQRIKKVVEAAATKDLYLVTLAFGDELSLTPFLLYFFCRE